MQGGSVTWLDDRLELELEFAFGLTEKIVMG